VKKLLEIGGYLNKGYHGFVDNYFMSVPLVCHLYQLSTYITGTATKNRKIYPSSSSTNLLLKKNLLQFWSPSRTVFRKKKSQKNPVIHLSSHATAQKEEVWGRHRGNPQIKPKIITSYNKFMGGIDSSDMMLYTYWDERRTVCYWRKVAFNIIARMVLNNYILYKENYRRPGKLKSRYNYTVSITVWLALKDNAGADDPRGPQGLRPPPEKKESQCTVCSQREKVVSQNSMHEMQQGSAWRKLP
jgi:hypothetical protein